MEEKKSAPTGEREDETKAVTIYLSERLKNMVFHESQRRGYTMKDLTIFIIQSHFQNTSRQ